MNHTFQAGSNPRFCSVCEHHESNPVHGSKMAITYAFDKQGGFYAKSVSEAGTIIEYAYPTSDYATAAVKNPAKVAQEMVGRTADLAYYETRSWWPERIARMTAEMDACPAESEADRIRRENMERVSSPAYRKIERSVVSGYDYENQAWVVEGKYLDCSHPQDMNCGCYGRLHAGETPAVSVKIR